METEFPEPSDFTDISSIPTSMHRASTASISSITSSESEQIVYDQIMIQPPPVVFAMIHLSTIILLSLRKQCHAPIASFDGKL